MLNNVEFREVGELVKVEKVKVVACDGKGTLYTSLWTTFFVFNFSSHRELSSVHEGFTQ